MYVCSSLGSTQSNVIYICSVDHMSLVCWSPNYKSTISKALKGTTRHMQWTTHAVAVKNTDTILHTFKGFPANFKGWVVRVWSTKCKCKASRASTNTMVMLVMPTCNLTGFCSPFILAQVNGGSTLVWRLYLRERSCSGKHCPTQLVLLLTNNHNQCLLMT